jgi:hypothetical protein
MICRRITPFPSLKISSLFGHLSLEFLLMICMAVTAPELSGKEIFQQISNGLARQKPSRASKFSRARSYSRNMEDKQGGSTRSERS